MAQSKKRQKPKRQPGVLWQVINGEPYLVDGEFIDKSWTGKWFFPKMVTRDGVRLGDPPRPLTLKAVQDMQPGECLDIEEVMSLAGCKSRLTVHRAVWAGRLTPVRSRKGGKPVTDRTRMLLFRADSVLEWLSKYPIKMGRPRKDRSK